MTDYPTPLQVKRALLRLRRQARTSCDKQTYWNGLDREALAVVERFYAAVTDNLRKTE